MTPDDMVVVDLNGNKVEGKYNPSSDTDVYKRQVINQYTRVCLKNHSRNLHAPLCGIFHPNSVAVARYGALIRAKYTTNCDAHLAESLFQTRSNLVKHCSIVLPKNK